MPTSRAAVSTPWASVVKNGFVMSGMTSAIVSVRLVRRLRATVFGMYPVSVRACSTRARSSGLTCAGSVDDPGHGHGRDAGESRHVTQGRHARLPRGRSALARCRHPRQEHERVRR